LMPVPMRSKVLVDLRPLDCWGGVRIPPEAWMSVSFECL
jgi:hypothetical protein